MRSGNQTQTAGHYPEEVRLFTRGLLCVDPVTERVRLTDLGKSCAREIARDILRPGRRDR